MAALSFEGWLYDKLKGLNVDPEIFGSYIQSILEGEETDKEKRDALEGIFEEEIGNEQLFDEILVQWNKYSCINDAKLKASSNGDLDAKLSRILEEQAKSVVCESLQLTSEEKHLRQVILNQYSEVSDGEEDVYQEDDPGGVSFQSLSRNTNAEVVANAERDKREKSKEDHEKKKAQDKLNREKQKQQQIDKAKKAKQRTQKNERKR